MADTCAAGIASNWPRIPDLKPLPVASLGILASIQLFLLGCLGLQETMGLWGGTRLCNLTLDNSELLATEDLREERKPVEISNIPQSAALKQYCGHSGSGPPDRQVELCRPVLFIFQFHHPE